MARATIDRLRCSTRCLIRHPPAVADPAPPSRLLNALVERIAQVRGAPIKNYGSMDLREQDAPKSIMQADESLYLHPGRARLPGPSAMVTGVDDHPDVVLEVDHTTDVRRGKLGSRPRPRPGVTSRPSQVW